MKFLFLSICIGFTCVVLKTSAAGYLRSSDQAIQRDHSSLKGYTSFVFSTVLEAKGKKSLPSWMEKKLREVTVIQEDSPMTPQGLDFDKMPHNFLVFSVEQLTDVDNSLLPIMKVKLETTAFVKIANNEESTLLTTNEWSAYVKKKDIDRSLPRIFSALLQQFAEQYQAQNPEKPILWLL